ncbi:MAG: anaerobic ribonucleoside-triphosphate reductase activating protein [Candidatus Omnitrophica bacterium]|nr:anaerobic ribonucleoside-triphosphate reductase activating protein [Candidatus Omnitrophota bacterium]
MQIGGLIKLSLVDYPGKTAAVVFTQGCNFRCPYCYNKELVIPSCFQAVIPEEAVISFLAKRKDVLGGVVITGGEPTLHKDLLEFLRRLQHLGYPVKLDTNGSRPDVLREVIQENLVDFIAMDLKAPLEAYEKLAGVPVSTKLIEESIAIIKGSGIQHQFRTTIVKSLLGNTDFLKLAHLVAGAQSYVLQNFSAQESVLDPVRTAGGAFLQDEFVNLKEMWEIRR